ncbi:tripartite tricarboxylate transporter substrate binding protein [Advenella sp. FME57]|uniref:Tripartite tricarboxylate transporter substrate binding protein n=1 Tax=Advenella kashmirensis TaxID=310575 RepID=A0A356LBZ1_9BURK|nr:tripartite tricarboxylate transporter substrate binding protein [Advenella sp. FME57]HBP28462.1 tripartite tricarboxylate transporter substrate binding protein [Advenella kashmirensis]
MSIVISIAKRALAAGLAIAFAGTAQAAYPDKPITIIVNYPPGGALDLATRAVSANLSTQFDQPIVIENKPGASGLIGAENAARQKPDGYTFLATIDSLVTVNPLIFGQKRFNPETTLDVISLLGTFEQVLLVPKTSEIKDLSSLIAASKAKALNYSSAGAGTPGHLAMESLRLALGINMTNIPFKGNAPALNALLGKQVDTGFLALGGSTLQHIKAGKLIPLAVAGQSREPALPDTPTLSESGIEALKDFDMQFSFLLMAPKGLDKTITEKWNAAVAQAMQSAQIKTQFDNLNVHRVNGSMQEAEQWMAKYGSRIHDTIRKANIKVE